MKFAETDPSEDGLAIKAYEPGAVVIGEGRFTHSVLLMPDWVTDWPVSDAAELASAHLEPIIERTPELLILGTGRRQRFPSPASYADLMRKHIGIEIMDTGAACRTYNILMAEGRRVAAALIID